MLVSINIAWYVILCLLVTSQWILYWLKTGDMNPWRFFRSSVVLAIIMKHLEVMPSQFIVQQYKTSNALFGSYFHLLQTEHSAPFIASAALLSKCVFDQNRSTFWMWKCLLYFFWRKNKIVNWQKKKNLLKQFEGLCFSKDSENKCHSWLNPLNH